MNKKDIKVILKIIGLIIFQSGMYLLAKLSPFSVHLLKSKIDDNIPFISHFIYFYISWYLMLVLIPFIFYKKDEKCFRNYMICSNVSIIIAFIIYFLYPTSIIRSTIPLTGFSGFITEIIYTIDTPILNCFPSMHCQLCFIYIFSILSCKNISKKAKFGIILWSLLVVVSTLFVKQHVLLDVISAFVLSITIFIAVNIIIKIKDKKISKKNN